MAGRRKGSKPARNGSVKDRKRVGSANRGRAAIRDQSVVQLISYHVTCDPLPDHDFDALPEEWRAELQPVYEEMPEDWKAAIPVLERGLERAPHIPRLWNLLSVAYTNVGRHDEADELIHETCRRFPDYLFARINLAHRHLADGEPEDVVAVLGWPLLLHVATDGRRTFHVSEFLGFNCVVGLYHLAVGDLKSAQVALETMEQLDDQHYQTEVLRNRVMLAGLRQRSNSK